MKLSDAFREWTAWGCPPLPDDTRCADLESPDDPHTQLCTRLPGHSGPHRDVDEWPNESGAFVDVVFDGPPDHESGRLVEVEDSAGRSIDAGEWIDRGNGMWALRLRLDEL